MTMTTLSWHPSLFLINQFLLLLQRGSGSFPSFSLCPPGGRYRKGEKRPRTKSNTKVFSWRRLLGAPFPWPSSAWVSLGSVPGVHPRLCGVTMRDAPALLGPSPLTLPIHAALFSSMSILRLGTCIKHTFTIPVYGASPSPLLAGLFLPFSGPTSWCAGDIYEVLIAILRCNLCSFTPALPTIKVLFYGSFVCETTGHLP